ncbi:MAG TPA: cytochrome C oxidase subunit IV family protein [Longimicrobiales bacterium]|nr:cytochrome C oxidase subunit IV family protein [Longimicrobiales bacterium]
MEYAEAQSGAAVESGGHATKKAYFVVFGTLAVLTAIEVAIPLYLHFDKTLQVVLLVALALWKALLVALFYMHLRYEPQRLKWMVIAPLPLAVILVMAVLTEF